jgi:hypothetical protein
MPVVVKKTCDQTIVEIYTCPAPDGVGGVPYIGVNVGGGVGVYKLTDQVVAPREHHFYTLVGINGTQVNRVGDLIQIEGGNFIEFATRIETDLGVITDKALNPDVGAYAYDRFRYVGQHAAGKGTETVTLTPVGSTVVVDQALSNVFELILDRDVNFSDPINPIKGQTVNIHLKQNETGGFNATFSSAWKFTNRIDPILTDTPNAQDMLSCQWDERSAVMKCSFLPDYGSGYIPPPIYDDTDLVFVNQGGGNEVCIGRSGLQVSFRTIVGNGDIGVSEVGDTVAIDYIGPPVPLSIGDLNDTDFTTDPPQTNDTLTFNGEVWIPARARRWTLGATWTNGNNLLSVPVNDVNSLVSENARIVAWYLLTTGGYGSCEVDVQRVPIMDFPPTSMDSICGSSRPTITAGFMNTDSDLIGWTTDLAAGDLLQFVLMSTSLFKTVQIILVLERLP